MNKIVPVTTLLLFTSALAQQTAPGPGRQMTPEMRQRFQQMQSVMDLAQTVRTLPDLEKNKATAISKAQAQQLLPLLRGLQKASSDTPDQAKKTLSQIEDKILNEQQLSTLDGLVIEAQKQRAAERAKRQASGQSGTPSPRIPGLPGGVFRGGQGGQNQTGQNQNGNAPRQFNPFKNGRGAEALNSYIELLKKK